MKYIAIMAFMLKSIYFCLGQTPMNDQCWISSPVWGDEFNGSSLDAGKWNQGVPWGIDTKDDNKVIRTDGNSTTVQNGYLSLKIAKENYKLQIGTKIDPKTNLPIPIYKTFPYTIGEVCTGNNWDKSKDKKFLYGY